MSYSKASSSTCVGLDSLAQVRPSLANRFYEPIVLLVGLTTSLSHNKPSRAPDLSLDAAQSSERAFHLFVNKLSQLCDSERGGGNTVTAFVVLQFPDHIEYRFTSNQRETRDFILGQKFITNILQTLGSAKKDELSDMTSHILRASLSFTRPRLEAYVDNLKKQAVPCIRACIMEDTDQSKSIIGKLKELQELLYFSDDADMCNEIFSIHCERLINAIDRLYQSEIAGLILDRTNEGRMNESTFWCELRHAAGRLLSYLQAVKVLVSTRKRWPELFEEFTVTFVASSIPGQNPLKCRNRPKDLSADKIIGRMTSDPTEMTSYKAHALELQKFKLDENIQKQAGNKRFHPIVHAEVLLQDSLERDGLSHPSKFFKGYKYIGCSKPTCRLCEYYFSARACGIEVRQTHRNLYPNWRLPDVYQHQGPQAEKRRENLMNKIVDRIREDAFRTLTEKLPERKHHDSNTEPTYPIDSIAGEEFADLEHLTSNFRDLDMGSSHDRAIYSSGESVLVNEDSFLTGESDDEQDGGVKL